MPLPGGKGGGETVKSGTYKQIQDELSTLVVTGADETVLPTGYRIMGDRRVYYWKIWLERLLDCIYIDGVDVLLYTTMSSYIQKRKIGDPRSAIPNTWIQTYVVKHGMRLQTNLFLIESNGDERNIIGDCELQINSP